MVEKSELQFRTWTPKNKVDVKICNYYTSLNKAHPAVSISISYRRIKYLYSNKDD
jgi:hypothetical protein